MGDDRLYVGRGCSGYKTLKTFYESLPDDDNSEMPISIDGMQGLILPTDENVAEGGIFNTQVVGLHDVTDNAVVTVKFRDPKYGQGYIFPARKLPKAITPPKVLKQGEDEGNKNYRPNIGKSFNLKN